MSVSSVGGPDPGFYSYPATAVTVPQGDAPAPGAQSSGSKSPYVAEYQNLQQQDAAELLAVSFGSASSAEANVENVLAQAAQLQGAQLAQRQLAAAQTANNAIQSVGSTPSTANNPLASVPSYTSIVNASDGTANQAIDNYVNNPSAGFDALA